MPSRKNDVSGAAHRFGGNWTDIKLDLLARYLHSYTTALQRTPFQIEYIDAFAGTGYRALSREDRPDQVLFPDLTETEPQELLDGSARIALKTIPRFHKYIFVEKSKFRCDQLQHLKAEFPELAHNITIKNTEANTYIRDLCAEDWRRRRAVMFLDPYGMQADWDTIEAIASTKAIDLWILFPLGEWMDAFYQVELPPLTLFEPSAPKLVKTAGLEGIGHFFNDRLKTIFSGVAPKPRWLSNSAGCPRKLKLWLSPRHLSEYTDVLLHILAQDTVFR